MTRQIIGVDIDDVLSATAEGFTTYSNRRWGNKHKAEQYTEAWAEFWGVSTEEAIKRSDEYHSSGALSRFSYYEQAVPVLRELSKKYKIVVITSRRKTLKTLTDAWLEEHFSGLFEEVHYAGIWDTDDNNHSIEYRLKQTKADVAQQLGVTYLIDDQLKHCVGAADVGIKALLFGNHPATRMAQLPDGVVRAEDWHKVREYFHAQS
jgi:uncharacterized HAD superfamily protein